MIGHWQMTPGSSWFCIPPHDPLSGWWFQTFFIFHNIWDVIRNPLTHIFQDG